MNQPKILNPDKGRFFKSVIFHAWLSFLSLAVVIIAIMATVFLVVYTFMYRNQRIDNLVKTGNYIVSSYPVDDNAEHLAKFEDILDEIVIMNNMSVIVFTQDDITENTKFEDVNMILYRISSGDDVEMIVNMDAITTKYFSILSAEKNTSFHFVLGNGKYAGSDLVIGGQKTANGKTVYFYIHSFIKDQDFATNFFYELFAGMSIIALGVSILYALIVGKKITYPLVKLSQDVRKAAGDEKYEITVEDSDYVEITELAQSFDYSIKEQKKTEHFRRDIVANVSHDLRTPLTMIKAYAEMIRDLSGDNPQRREEHCEIIINEVDTLNALVGDLLDLSKLQAGTVELDLKCVEMGYIVKTVLDRLDIFRERDGYEFVTDIDSNCLCECDRNRIEQVVYNLVCNAINYTGEDKKVFVSLKVKDGKIRFSVRDTGKGIKQEELDRIWDRYYRANQTKRSVAGSGIGLSIVQNILIKHGMEFGVDSKVGEGSTFWFEAKESTE
ncbi:MAG: HAMP domain-containing histidine kinase [Clostridia bacterium]|nr:HAMP domain-containing histidine kinase [Clostridia bacterium]